MDSIIALCVLAKQVWRIATDGKFAGRPKDLAVFPGDVKRSLTAHRATLMQESLEEIECAGCVLGGEYYPCRNTGMVANSLNVVKTRKHLKSFPSQRSTVIKTYNKGETERELLATRPKKLRTLP